MSETCVIYDNNENYGRRLMGAISIKAQADFNVLLFTKQNELERFLEEREPQLMLVSENGYYKDICDMYKGRLLVLTEEMCEKDEAKKYGDNAAVIYRYQSFDKIYRQILEAGGIKQKRLNGTVRVAGIYTPVAVVERNAFSLCMARHYSLTKKTLYINIEEFSGLGEILAGDNDLTLSDALYYYRQNNERTEENIRNTIVTRDGLDYIVPIRCAEDISYTDVHQIMDFIDYLSRQYAYEVIVADISCAIRSPWKLLSNCSEVYVPQKDDYISMCRLEDMKKYFVAAGLDKLQEKIKYIRIPEGEAAIMTDFWNKMTGSGLYRYAKKIVEEAK